MRYAVPLVGGKLSAHFGHCEQFALIDVDALKKTILSKELVAPPEHQPGILPVWLAEEGANVIIAGGMGSRAQDLFRDNHIEVVVGAVEHEPEELVLAHMNATLTLGGNICDH